ncbi:hypothetical protein Bbelb_183510 [Branchiostoma belcheri]|nr:hypothetical protein Bbelb_183510 [Branchiostoma belcheri]
MEGGGDKLPPSPFRSSGPLFPVKLRELADDPTIRSVRWSPTGATLLIHQKLLEEELLDQENGAFKTRTFSSFYRQLNLYGFRRARGNKEGRPEHSDGSREAAELREFYHMYFQRDQPELLSLVRRPSCSRAALSERRVERVRLLQGESPQDRAALSERPAERTRLLQGESPQDNETVTSSNLFHNCKHQTPDGGTADILPQVNRQSMPVIPAAASPAPAETVTATTSTGSTIQEGTLYDTFVSTGTSPGTNVIYQSLWTSNILAGDRKTSALDQGRPLFCSPRGSAMIQPQEFSLRPRVPGPRRNLFGAAANQQVPGAVGQAVDVTSQQIPGQSCDAAIQQIPVIIGAGRFQPNTSRNARVEQMQSKLPHEGKLRLEVPRIDLEEQPPSTSKVPCLDAPGMGVPWQDLPQVMVPHVKVPHVKVPQVKVPLSEVPQIHVSPAEEPRLDERQIHAAKVATQQTEVPHAQREPQHTVPRLEEQQTKRLRSKASPGQGGSKSNFKPPCPEELPAGLSLIEVVWMPPPQAGLPQTKVAPDVKTLSLREPNTRVPGVQLQRVAPSWMEVPRIEVDTPFGIDVTHKVVPLDKVPQMRALPVEVSTPQPRRPALDTSQYQREVPRLEVSDMKMRQIEMPEMKRFPSAPQPTVPPAAASQSPQPMMGPTVREENPAEVEVCARCRRKSGPSGEHADDIDLTAGETTLPVELETNTTAKETMKPACHKPSVSEVSIPSPATNELSPVPEVFVPPPARNPASPSTGETCPFTGVLHVPILGSPKKRTDSSCHVSMATGSVGPVVMAPDSPDDVDDVSFLTVANFEEVMTSPSKRQKAYDERESQADKTPCEEAKSKQSASPAEQESTHLCLEKDSISSPEDVSETPKRKYRRRCKKRCERAMKAPRKKVQEMTPEEEVLAAVRAIQEEVRKEEITLDPDEVPAVSEPQRDMPRTFHDKPRPQHDMPRQLDMPRTPTTKPSAGFNNASLSVVNLPIVSYAGLAPEDAKKLPFKKRFYSGLVTEQNRSAAVLEPEEQRALSSSIDDLIVLGTSITLVPPPDFSVNVVTEDLRTENVQKTPEVDTTSVSQDQVYIPINYKSGLKAIASEVECGEENFQDFEVVEIVELDCEIATEQCLRDGQRVTSGGEVQQNTCTIQQQQGEGHVAQPSNTDAQFALQLIPEDVTINEAKIRGLKKMATISGKKGVGVGPVFIVVRRLKMQ